MVSKEEIFEIFNIILSEYINKCNTNKIPSTDNNYVRISEKSRETMDRFISENCGDNYNPNERLWVIAAGGISDGDNVLYANGNEDAVKLNDEQIEYLDENYSENGSMYHEIHNHPHVDGYGSRMYECLSPEDIMQCVTHDWSKSITAVNGRNNSRMTLMKSNDFSNDYEVESIVLNQALSLRNKYFEYMDNWERETRRVWDNDEANGGAIAREFRNSLPAGTKNVIPLVHEHYEDIAKKNIGSFEESITDIRKTLNRYGLDISIEE